MTHYLKTENGDFAINIEMACGHPDMTNNSVESVGCNGNCCVCRHSKASCNTSDMMQLLKIASCMRLQ